MLGKRGSSWFAAQVRDFFAQAIITRARILSTVGLRVGAPDAQNAVPLEFVIMSLANLSRWPGGAYASPTRSLE